jgi:O-methyltransferase
MQASSEDRSETTLPSALDLYIDLLKKCLTASLYDESSWRVIEGTILGEDRTIRRPFRFLWGHIRRITVGILQRNSMVMVRQRLFNPSARHEGVEHPTLFGYTMVGHRRLDNVQKCVEDVIEQNVPADFIETGVWRGGTTIFMRALLKLHGVTDRVVWVADSFEGLPKPASGADGWDISFVKYMSVSLEQVQRNFQRFGLLDEQVRFLKGWFCDTMPNAPIERLAILRLDGDLYSSTLDVLRSLYHRVSPGGYVIIDDYYSGESCRRAVSDFLRDTGIKPEIQKIDWGGAFWKVEGPGTTPH